VPIGNAHSYANSYSHGNTDRDSYSYSYSYPYTNANLDSYAHRYTYCNPDSDANGDTDRDSHSYPYANAEPDCDSHRYAYAHAGPDHTQRAWLQSAGFANGGPLMDRGDFEQRRRLPQRRVEGNRLEQRFLHGSPQWPRSCDLYLQSMRGGHR
jgi:hypothetical protein